jgi:hypothetical protein
VAHWLWEELLRLGHRQRFRGSNPSGLHFHVFVVYIYIYIYMYMCIYIYDSH